MVLETKEKRNCCLFRRWIKDNLDEEKTINFCQQRLKMYAKAEHIYSSCY